MRETRLSFIGDELVAGHGDGRALGWTGRVMARTPRDAEILWTSLAVPGETTAQMSDRWGPVDAFEPLRNHEQWTADVAAAGGMHPGQAGYGLLAWLVLHRGWYEWLGVERPEA